HALTHDHRVAPSEQDTGDLGVRAYVFGHLVDLAGCELQVRIADELRPAEAVGAVRMTRLPLLRKEEHRLAVLVLNTRNGFLVAQLGHVEVHLTCGVRVELGTRSEERRGGKGCSEP